LTSKINIKKLLSDCKTIAVIGLSSNPDRVSYRVAQYLQKDAGYKIIPVNPNISEVLGEKSYNTLKDIPSDIKIDVVNIFRRSEFLESVALEAVERGDLFFWAQLGIYNKKAAEILDKSSISYLMNQCIFVEHQKCLFNE